MVREVDIRKYTYIERGLEKGRSVLVGKVQWVIQVVYAVDCEVKQTQEFKCIKQDNGRVLVLTITA